MQRWLICFAVMLAGVAPAQEAADEIAPEAAGAGLVSGSAAVMEAQERKERGVPVEAAEWMVVAAHPLASEAGARVLAEGGTAADAMVAVQVVLGLVEPQSSGLGGGGFLVWYDGLSGKLTTLDGREAAPLEVTPRLLQEADGTPLGFFEAIVGGRSVGVPGLPALMAEAHARWGRAPWESLFADAITLAEEGFVVTPRLEALVEWSAEWLVEHPVTSAYFLPGDEPLAAGDRLRNPEYAQTLRRMAQEGADVFYQGPLAEDIVRTVREGHENAGFMSLLDLSIYRVKEREPVCIDYREHAVCGMGPPSSGGLAVGQILGLLEHFDLAAMGPDDVEAWRLIGDASRLAFADRGRYVADTDHVPVPVQGLLARRYLDERAALLRGDDALPEVAPGRPEFDHSLNLADDLSPERPGTTQISIIDRYGNALSMTSTIEMAFGSHLMVNGFLLNNQLTDFSFRSHVDGVPVANRVAPGKRPRSSMAPTIVLKDDVPVLVLGSPGGSRIIGYVAKTIIAHLDWGLDVQAAINLPHLVNRFGPYDLEAGTEAEALAPALRDMGYEINETDMTSGLHAISVGGVLKGGADPRREGIALGE